MFVLCVCVWDKRGRETIQKVNKDNVASKMGADYKKKIKFQINYGTQLYLKVNQH